MKLNIKRSFKLIIAHNENIKTFEAISKHLEMEEERWKLSTHSNMTFVAKREYIQGQETLSWQQAQ